MPATGRSFQRTVLSSATVHWTPPLEEVGGGFGISQWPPRGYYEGVRHVLGLAFVSFGLALIWAAERRRRRVLLAPAREPLNPSLVVFGDIARPIILCALGYLGVKLSLVYLMLDAGRWFSLLDLGGLLFLLGAYGRWMVVWTRYRVGPASVLAPTQKPEEAAEGALPAAPGPRGLSQSPASLRRAAARG